MFMIFFCIYRKRINSFYLNKDGNKDKSNEKKDENEDKNGEKKHRYEADYILGYLVIKDDFTKVVIKIRGFLGYLCSIFNCKTIYIFL